MAGQIETTELGAIRHDLKNLLTSLRHGCTLIGSMLPRAEHAEVHAFLEEMRACVEKGGSLAERLREIDARAAPAVSGRPAHQVVEQ